MRLAGRLMGWLIALIAAAALHLLAFQVWPEREETALLAGGRAQLQLGLDQAARRSAPAPAEPDVEAHQEPQARPEAAPASSPAPEPEPEPEVTQADAFIPEHVEPAQPEPEPRREVASDPVAAPDPAPEAPPDSPDRADPLPHGARATSQEDAERQDVEAGPEQEEDGQQARVGEKDAPNEAQQAGNAASDNYAGEVMRHLSRVRRPRASGPGAALVSFTVAPDGSLERVSIATSSGSGRFDRDAVRMIERAAPFPQPPPGVNRDFTIEIEGQ